jgi:hypothetical protein
VSLIELPFEFAIRAKCPELQYRINDIQEDLGLETTRQSIPYHTIEPQDHKTHGWQAYSGVMKDVYCSGPLAYTINLAATISTRRQFLATGMTSQLRPILMPEDIVMSTSGLIRLSGYSSKSPISRAIRFHFH